MRWRKWHVGALAKVYLESTTDQMRDVIPYRSKGESKLSKANYELKEMGLITIEDSLVYGHYDTDLTDEGKRIFESLPLTLVLATLEALDWWPAMTGFLHQASKAELAGYLVHNNSIYRRAALERFQELCS